MRKEVERLILQARRDLENARKNTAIQAFEVSAFLSHEAVAKYLKGPGSIKNDGDRLPLTTSQS